MPVGGNLNSRFMVPLRLFRLDSLLVVSNCTSSPSASSGVGWKCALAADSGLGARLTKEEELPGGVDSVLEGAGMEARFAKFFEVLPLGGLPGE